MKCGAEIHMKTIAHSDHVCTVDVWICHLNTDFNHSGTKHACACGVRWTKDPILADEGRQWSKEIDITPSPVPENQQHDKTESDDPN